MMRQIALAAMIMLAPGLAHADRKAADACAQGLSADSRDIYATTLSKNPTSTSQARSYIVAEAERLMKTGKLTMSQARAAGESAGQCMELIEK
jgi:hypothetical protein